MTTAICCHGNLKETRRCTYMYNMASHCSQCAISNSLMMAKLLNATNARLKSTLNSSQRYQTLRSTRHNIFRRDELPASVPGLFVPKTFRSQEQIVPMGNFRFRDFSFPRLFVPWNFRSRALSFTGTFVPEERNFRSLDLSFRGTFVPMTFRS